MKVYEALASAFAAEGTTDVFGMMGDANMHWMTRWPSRACACTRCATRGQGSAWPTGGPAPPEASASSPRPAGRAPPSSPLR